MSLYVVHTAASPIRKAGVVSSGAMRRRRYLVDRNGSAAARYAVQSYLQELRQADADSNEGSAYVTGVSLAVNNPAYVRALSSSKGFRATRLP